MAYEELHRRFTEMEVPRCTCCGGGDTASVQVGVIGLTIRLAATCRKFKLIGNGPKPGEWFCHGCESFFDTWAPCSPGLAVKADGELEFSACQFPREAAESGLQPASGLIRSSGSQPFVESH